jgi:hypothetical protein
LLRALKFVLGTCFGLPGRGTRSPAWSPVSRAGTRPVRRIAPLLAGRCGRRVAPLIHLMAAPLLLHVGQSKPPCLRPPPLSFLTEPGCACRVAPAVPLPVHATLEWLPARYPRVVGPCAGASRAYDRSAHATPRAVVLLLPHVLATFGRLTTPAVRITPHFPALSMATCLLS